MPKNKAIVTQQPKNQRIIGEFTNTFTVVLGAGMYMGLPFLLTYPSAITVIQGGEAGGAI